FIMFILLGSTNVINVIFSLDISTKQIIILAAILLVYLFTIDNVFEIACELLVGKNMASILVMLLIRIFVFYLIMLLIGSNQKSGFTMAIGVAMLIALL